MLYTVWHSMFPMDQKWPQVPSTRLPNCGTPFQESLFQRMLDIKAR